MNLSNVKNRVENIGFNQIKNNTIPDVGSIFRNLFPEFNVELHFLPKIEEIEIYLFNNMVQYCVRLFSDGIQYYNNLQGSNKWVLMN